MMKIIGMAWRAGLCLTLTGGAVAAQAQSSPLALLQASMKKYQTLHSFQADCKLTLPGGSSAQRTIAYAKPNRYRVTTKTAKGQMETSVSNGKDVNEYANIPDMDPTQYPAPANISAADSMYMQQPTLCGSILYSFFGGPSKLSAFVADVHSVQFGPTVTIDGQKCRTVKFAARGKYGEAEIAIGTNDLLAHRIQYGSAALELGRGKAKNVRTIGAAPAKRVTTTETYGHIVTNQEIADATFDTKTPQEQVASAQGGQEEADKPPVALGKPAPAFEVTSVDGKKTKLSDMKGKIVLIDFWATWCPPCRKGLPETQKSFDKYADKGLAVMAISAEDKATVTPFLKENSYTFPTYIDGEGKANTAYGITGIPTIAVIDREGKLIAYMIGLRDPEEILAALKKAGLNTD